MLLADKGCLDWTHLGDFQVQLTESQMGWGVSSWISYWGVISCIKSHYTRICSGCCLQGANMEGAL